MPKMINVVFGSVLLFFLPVLLHGQASPTLLLSQSQLQFTAAAGGGVIPSQSVAVINTGGGTANWTATASTLSGGGWLSLSPASGTSAAGALSPPQVEVQVNVTGLAPSVYFGNVRVDAAGVDNSPFFVSVTLNLLPQGSNPGVLVRPTGLVFVQPASGAAPAAQTVRLTSTALSSLEAVANPSTFAGGAWLTSTRSVTLSPGSPQALSVQLSPSSLTTLAPGQYFGAVALLFGDQTSATVNVLLLVTPPVTVSCTPQRLLLADELGSNFGVLPNTGTVVQTQAKDDCGNPITNATVSASFSNGNPTLQLTHVGNGLYSGTWVASGGPAVTVTLTATSSGLTSAQVQRQGQVLAAGSTQIFSRGVVNAASFAPNHPLAPGEIISVFGQNLLASCPIAFARAAPLPTTLGCVSLLADGQPIPLFAAFPSQINAQLPAELTPGSTVRVVARITPPSGGPDIISLPVAITIAESDPGIFAANSQGTGQAAVLNQDFSANSASNPAARGAVIQMYTVGLGRTNPLFLSGQAASASPVNRVVNPVQVTVGGVQADILFAGLAPGFVGLYQINVRVPQEVTPGSAVPVVLTQRGVSSNTVTVAVR